MEYLLEIIIFLIIAFIYLHIIYHHKTSNDYEIYELDHLSKDKLNEVCDLRQPVVFYYDNKINQNCRFSKLSSEAGSMDVKIRDISETNESDEMYIPLTLHNTEKLLKKDSESRYISENNNDFIKEVGLDKHFKLNEDFIKPYLASSSEYDMLSGSHNSYTPLRYNLTYRNFYYVTEGSVSIKLTPPNSSKYLTTEKDFENFEFRSPVNPWNVQKEYEKEISKIRFVEITLTPGMMFYIPPYWWYSMKFSCNASEHNCITTVTSFKYKTVMNTVSISPLLFIHLLQSFNVKRKFMKTFFYNKNTASNKLKLLGNNKESTDVKVTSENSENSQKSENSENSENKKEKISQRIKKDKSLQGKASINTNTNSNTNITDILIKPALSSDSSPLNLLKNSENKKTENKKTENYNKTPKNNAFTQGTHAV